MASTSRLEMEKFNSTDFDLWKLKIEELLVDEDHLVAISETKPTSMKNEEWAISKRKTISIIRICLVDSMLLNVSK